MEVGDIVRLRGSESPLGVIVDIYRRAVKIAFSSRKNDFGWYWEDEICLLNQ